MHCFGVESIANLFWSSRGQKMQQSKSDCLRVQKVGFDGNERSKEQAECNLDGKSEKVPTGK